MAGQHVAAARRRTHVCGDLVGRGLVPRRGQPRHCRRGTSPGPTGLVVALEPQIAVDHCLLEQLPLRVTAPDAMDLALDGLKVGERAGVVAGHVRRVVIGNP